MSACKYVCLRFLMQSHESGGLSVCFCLHTCQPMKSKPTPPPKQLDTSLTLVTVDTSP